MKQHLPDAKLIACLRDPTERAYSRFWNSKAEYDKNATLTFEQKLIDRPEFIAEGFYFDQLSRFYGLFPRDNILVTLYDDLHADPVAFMQSLYRFLGVDTSFDAGLRDIRVNAAAGKKRLAKSRVLWGASKLLTHLGMHTAAESLRRDNRVEMPPMNQQTRDHLNNVYGTHNRKLEQLIGRDLSQWGRC